MVTQSQKAELRAGNEQLNNLQDWKEGRTLAVIPSCIRYVDVYQKISFPEDLTNRGPAVQCEIII
jgi:hypothetical protein